MKKYALITGASSGIGYELAKVFAKNNHNLILVSRDNVKLEALATTIKAQSQIDVICFACDLSLQSEVKQLIEKIITRNLDVEYLINNAGFGLFGKFSETDINREIEMINLNIIALTYLTKRFLKIMLEKNSGKIMNVASTAAFQPGPLMSVYYATKAYVLYLSEAIANEIKGTNVSMTILCPGPTLSNFQKVANLDGSKVIKLRKMATSDEVANYAYKAMMRNKTIAIYDSVNKLLAQSYRFLPRKFLVNIIRKIQEKRK